MKSTLCISALLLCVLLVVLSSTTSSSVVSAQDATTASPSSSSTSSASTWDGKSAIPTLTGLSQTQEAYQLQVWAFIVVLVIGLLGFTTMASIDYSDDALLTSAPDNSKME